MCSSHHKRHFGLIFLRHWRKMRSSRPPSQKFVSCFSFIISFAFFGPVSQNESRQFISTAWSVLKLLLSHSGHHGLVVSYWFSESLITFPHNGCHYLFSIRLQLGFHLSWFLLSMLASRVALHLTVKAVLSWSGRFFKKSIQTGLVVFARSLSTDPSTTARFMNETEAPAVRLPLHHSIIVFFFVCQTPLPVSNQTALWIRSAHQCIHAHQACLKTGAFVALGVIFCGPNTNLDRPSQV